jgi:hypothetical protein
MNDLRSSDPPRFAIAASPGINTFRMNHGRERGNRISVQKDIITCPPGYDGAMCDSLLSVQGRWPHCPVVHPANREHEAQIVSQFEWNRGLLGAAAKRSLAY